MSDSLWPHGLQYARPPCPSPTPGVDSNSCPLHRWCHPTISSSVIPYSSCLQSFPASGSFLMSWLFTSDGQIIGASALASVLPINIQDWFPLRLTGLIFLQSKRLSRIFANTTVEKHQSFGAQPSLWSIVLSGRDKMMGKKSMQNPFIDEVFIVPKRYIIKEIKWPYSIVFIVIRKISRVVG